MKRISIFSTAVLLLLFGTAILAKAQREQPENDRNRAKPEQKMQPSAAKPENQTKQQPSYGGAYHGGVQYDGPTNGGVHHSGVPQHSGQVRDGFLQSRAGSWKNEHQSWRQRGGYTGFRIPENRFRLYFGREHFFRIAGLPMVFVGGQPRFQYDGFWFTCMDPWPETWAPNWYETDDVYLDYTDDGYYLYNRHHPEFPIAVTVTF
jgi:hypothetical protein